MKTKKKLSLSPSGYIISNPADFTNSNEFIDIVEQYAKLDNFSKKKKVKSAASSTGLKLKHKN